MASDERRYSKEEIARRGDALYETEIRPHLSPEDEGMLVAIDIDSGTYVVDGDELEALQRLRKRRPDAQIWLKRVGSRYVHRFGGHDQSIANVFRIHASGGGDVVGAADDRSPVGKQS